MALLIQKFGRLFWFMRRKPAAKRGYTEEVLYAGWVDTVPPKVRAPRSK